jgi:hypothetical protein
VVEELVRHAIGVLPRRAAHAPTAHDQQVGVVLLGNGDQRVGSAAAFDDFGAQLASEPGRRLGCLAQLTLKES